MAPCSKPPLTFRTSIPEMRRLSFPHCPIINSEGAGCAPMFTIALDLFIPRPYSLPLASRPMRKAKTRSSKMLPAAIASKTGSCAAPGRATCNSPWNRYIAA